MANLLGHWPSYEVRVKTIFGYTNGDSESCKATFYIGTSPDTDVPQAFLSDFFSTSNKVAWVGFGVQKLDPKKFAETFQLRAAGELGADKGKSAQPGFYKDVYYKGSVFSKGVFKEGGRVDGAFEADDFVPANHGQQDSSKFVLAEIVHNKTGDRKPYILRRDNKFVIGDIPFSYMHEGDRYFAFADLLFDILGEEPYRSEKLAFVRLEDIYNKYDVDLLNASFASLTHNEVPISIAHIPLFADPFNALGYGATKTPVGPEKAPEFLDVIRKLTGEADNAILWHGVTHQLGTRKNPSSGASGDDYEFWDAVRQRPIRGDGPNQVLERLGLGLNVFDSYGVTPRYWVTPHYQASAVDNVVFGRVFPWVIGRVTYYPTSVGKEFVLKPVETTAALQLPAVTATRLDELEQADWGKLDTSSKNGESQIFPFEIYRDIYGQRIIPETLNYLELEGTEPDTEMRDVPQILADAKRNLVVRDYWASAFLHPYLFNTKAEGGGGQFRGDASRLDQLLNGLKELGYHFTGLAGFEQSLREKEAGAQPQFPTGE